MTPMRSWALLFVLGASALMLAQPSGRRSPPAMPGARVSPVAEAAWSGSSVNVVANIRQALFTHGAHQFAAFYDAEQHVVLAKRQVGTDRWDVRRTQYRGNAADAHNSISLAVDGAGMLHVSWDHHVNPLNYARGVAPGSVELGPKEPMMGAREDRVTYPQFWRLPSGDLLFLYRDGASGRGALVLNRYSVASRAWTTVQSNLVDGEGARSPYWDMAVDRAGTLHLAWIWRESPDVATNHDLCYARSTDEGRTWSRSDGTALSLPVTAATAEYAVRIEQNSNLMNSPALTTDHDGRPYAVTYWSSSPGSPPRFRVVHHDGLRWRVVEGPARSVGFTLAGGGTKAPPISRAVVLVESSGTPRHLHLVYRDAAIDGVVMATRPWPGDGEWAERRLADEPLGAWEPAIDPVAWSRSAELHMLVQRVAQRDGDDRRSIETPPTPIGVLSWKVAR